MCAACTRQPNPNPNPNPTLTLTRSPTWPRSRPRASTPWCRFCSGWQELLAPHRHHSRPPPHAAGHPPASSSAHVTSCLPGPGRRYRPSDAQRALHPRAAGPGRACTGAPVPGGRCEQRRHRLHIPGRTSGDGQVSAYVSECEAPRSRLPSTASSPHLHPRPRLLHILTCQLTGQSSALKSTTSVVCASSRPSSPPCARRRAKARASYTSEHTLRTHSLKTTLALPILIKQPTIT